MRFSCEHGQPEGYCGYCDMEKMDEVKVARREGYEAGMAEGRRHAQDFSHKCFLETDGKAQYKAGARDERAAVVKFVEECVVRAWQQKDKDLLDAMAAHIGQGKHAAKEDGGP